MPVFSEMGNDIEPRDLDWRVTDPFLISNFEEIVSRLPKPAFVNEGASGRKMFSNILTQPQVKSIQAETDELIAELREGKYELPILSFDEEARLLGEAGDFPFKYKNKVYNVKWPACCFKDQCIAFSKQLGIVGFPFNQKVLTSLIFPSEFDSFIEGSLRLESRPCLLCLRNNLSAYVNLSNTIAFFAGSAQRAMVHGNKNDNKVLFQLYQVRVGGDNYHQSTLHDPSNTLPLGVIGNFPQFRPDLLNGYTCQDQGNRCMINQERMRHSNHNRPGIDGQGSHGENGIIGVNVADFLRRVSSNNQQSRDSVLSNIVQHHEVYNIYNDFAASFDAQVRSVGSYICYNAIPSRKHLTLHPHGDFLSKASSFFSSPLKMKIFRDALLSIHTNETIVNASKTCDLTREKNKTLVEALTRRFQGKPPSELTKENLASIFVVNFDFQPRTHVSDLHRYFSDFFQDVAIRMSVFTREYRKKYNHLCASEQVGVVAEEDESGLLLLFLQAAIFEDWVLSIETWMQKNQRILDNIELDHEYHDFEGDSVFGSSTGHRMQVAKIRERTSKDWKGCFIEIRKHTRIPSAVPVTQWTIPFLGNCVANLNWNTTKQYRSNIDNTLNKYVLKRCAGRKSNAVVNKTLAVDDVVATFVLLAIITSITGGYAHVKETNRPSSFFRRSMFGLVNRPGLAAHLVLNPIIRTCAVREYMVHVANQLPWFRQKLVEEIGLDFSSFQNLAIKCASIVRAHIAQEWDKVHNITPRDHEYHVYGSLFSPDPVPKQPGSGIGSESQATDRPAPNTTDVMAWFVETRLSKITSTQSIFDSATQKMYLSLSVEKETPPFWAIFNQFDTTIGEVPEEFRRGRRVAKGEESGDGVCIYSSPELEIDIATLNNPDLVNTIIFIASRLSQLNKFDPLIHETIIEFMKATSVPPDGIQDYIEIKQAFDGRSCEKKAFNRMFKEFFHKWPRLNCVLRILCCYVKNNRHRVVRLHDRNLIYYQFKALSERANAILQRGFDHVDQNPPSTLSITTEDASLLFCPDCGMIHNFVIASGENLKVATNSLTTNHTSSLSGHIAKINEMIEDDLRVTHGIEKSKKFIISPNTSKKIEFCTVQENYRAPFNAPPTVVPYGFDNGPVLQKIGDDKMFTCRHHEQGSVYPLVSMLMVGKLVITGNRTLFLCPQENCGKIAEMKPHAHLITERGPACFACSVRLTMSNRRTGETVTIKNDGTLVHNQPNPSAGHPIEKIVNAICKEVNKDPTLTEEPIKFIQQIKVRMNPTRECSIGLTAVLNRRIQKYFGEQVKELSIRCVCCDNAVKRSDRAFLYSVDGKEALFVCSKKHNQQLQVAVQTAVEEKKITTYEEMSTFIIDQINKQKEKFHKDHQKQITARNRRQINNSRRRAYQRRN